MKNNLDFAKEIQQRTKKFTVSIIRFVKVLPKAEECRVLGRQILRSGTSVASNYRAVCRAKSKVDFVFKMKIVCEEADETLFWFELFEEAELVEKSKMKELKTEGEEILKIVSKSITTVKRNQ